MNRSYKRNGQLPQTRRRQESELQQAVDAITPLESVLFTPPREDDSHGILEAAEVIAGIAKTISSADEGHRFPAADRFLGSALTSESPAGSQR